jgi:DHA1 family bicyclomycin/chloramphenicol resistance-like MFS transporter
VSSTVPVPTRGISTPELVALVAFCMALAAMSIDAMLPALGVLAADLGAADPNDRQLVVTSFLAGNALGQILYGPVADAVGRKRTMYVALAVLAAGTLVCLVAQSFPMMLAGRVVSGLGTAGTRIVSLAIVRDLYEGRAMARIMSFVSVIFIAVPIVAPSIGQGVLLAASWRAIFAVLAVMTVGVWIWFAARQPETLPRERRLRPSAGPILRAFGEVLRTRQTMAYTFAAGLVFSALVSYLGTAQQIFGEQYGLGSSFPIYFATLAASIGAAAFLNARLVMRFGMRALSNAALHVSAGASGIFLAVSFATGGHPPLWAFMACMMTVFFCNGLLFGNFNALAMEPMGHIAGSAAAVIGTLTSIVSVSIGTPIGRAYDGTVIPLVAGFFVMTLAALVVTKTAARRPSSSD